MSLYRSSFAYILIVSLLLMLFCSCKKYKAYNQTPELESVQQGLKACTAIGYCVSIATSAYEGYSIPDNVTFNKSTGLFYIKIDNNHPLPFNKNIGDIIIASQWNNDGGIMSILFANIDILNGKIKLYGLYTIPFMKRSEDEGIWAVFAKQDIVLGNGSDTILNLSNITNIVFNDELSRLNNEKPTDAFVAVKQNVWFINVNQQKSYSNVYDDDITIQGGGQIAEIQGATGGVMYHALINAKINYSICNQNPISGNAFSQNLKAGGDFSLDLGNSLLSFHNTCDGKAHVDFSTGKYLFYSGKNVSLYLY